VLTVRACACTRVSVDRSGLAGWNAEWRHVQATTDELAERIAALQAHQAALIARIGRSTKDDL
jgi:hypothetical protein